MKVSDQLHVPAALPTGKQPAELSNMMPVYPRAGLDAVEEVSCIAGLCGSTIMLLISAVSDRGTMGGREWNFRY
jgi:hypothetical protein